MADEIVIEDGDETTEHHYHAGGEAGHCEHCAEHAERIAVLEQDLARALADLTARDAQIESEVIEANIQADDAADTAEMAVDLALDALEQAEEEAEYESTEPGESVEPGGASDLDTSGGNPAGSEANPISIQVEPEPEPRKRKVHYGWSRGR